MIPTTMGYCSLLVQRKRPCIVSTVLRSIKWNVRTFSFSTSAINEQDHSTSSIGNNNINNNNNSSTVPASSVKQLYRDCLRLVRHMAPGMFNENNRKAIALRTTVKSEFRKNSHLSCPTAIESAKMNAIRALSNYYVLKSSQNDTKIHRAATNFHERSVQSAIDSNDDDKK